MQPPNAAGNAHRTISQFGVALVILASSFTSVANLIFRAAMSETNSLSAPLIIDRLLHRTTFYAAWVLYVAAIAIWFRVLQTEPLSSAYPILTSITFTLVSAGAVLLFHEEMSVMKVAGMVLILFGVALVSK